MKRDVNVAPPGLADAPPSFPGGASDQVSEPAIGQDLAQALLATGMDMPDALCHVLGACGVEGVRATWPSLLAGAPIPGGRLMDVLDRVATVSPDDANGLLGEVLSAGKMEPWTSPKGWSGAIHLNDRSWVTSLPKGVQISCDLDLSRSGLGSLPEGMSVKGAVDLTDSTRLRSIGKGFQASGFLWANGCAALTDLPQWLSVGEDLVLVRCSGIQTLPDGLSVGGCLDIRGGVAWDGVIPDDAEVYGVVWTDAGYHDDLKAFRQGTPRVDG